MQGEESEESEVIVDTDFRELPITNVRECEGGYEIESEGGWLSMSNESGVVPKIGDVARFYPRAYGYSVRGLSIVKVVRYRTEEEEKECHRKWCEDYHRKKREDFEKGKAALDAQYESLPPEFRARLDRLRRNNSDFRWDHEAYEMSACVDAVKIARTLKTGDAVHAFGEEKWEVQKGMVSGLFKGHSGNSFGAAVHLAVIYLESPENVDKYHGALCPLVGCKEYGCYASEGGVK